MHHKTSYELSIYSTVFCLSFRCRHSRTAPYIYAYYILVFFPDSIMYMYRLLLLTNAFDMFGDPISKWRWGRIISTWWLVVVFLYNLQDLWIILAKRKTIFPQQRIKHSHYMLKAYIHVCMTAIDVC